MVFAILTCPFILFRSFFCPIVFGCRLAMPFDTVTYKRACNKDEEKTRYEHIVHVHPHACCAMHQSGPKLRQQFAFANIASFEGHLNNNVSLLFATADANGDPFASIIGSFSVHRKCSPIITFCSCAFLVRTNT